MQKELDYATESANLQKQILEELQKLKESPLKGIDVMDNDRLREERDRLLDENTKMNTKATPSKDDSSTVRYLRSKVSMHIFFRIFVVIFKYSILVLLNRYLQGLSPRLLCQW